MHLKECVLDSGKNIFTGVRQAKYGENKMPEYGIHLRGYVEAFVESELKVVAEYHD